MQIQELITTIAAVIGTFLGIYNFKHAMAAERVKLRVIPKATSFQGTDLEGREFYKYSRDHYDPLHPKSPAETLSLEVVNLSAFPVIVDDVGLIPRWPGNRLALINPIIKDGKPWPRELKPRESLTVDFIASRLLDLKDIGRVKKAYASTVCGSTCYGTSGALKDFIHIARGIA